MKKRPRGAGESVLIPQSFQPPMNLYRVSMTGVWIQHMILGVTQGWTMLLAEKRHTICRFQGAILNRAKMSRQRLSRLAPRRSLSHVKFRAGLRIGSIMTVHPTGIAMASPLPPFLP